MTKSTTFTQRRNGTFAALTKPTRTMPRSASTLLLVLCSLALAAQSAAEPPADFLRSINKMYVVVAVIAVVFLGIVFYLWSLDRKISDVENQIKDHA